MKITHCVFILFFCCRSLVWASEFVTVFRDLQKYHSSTSDYNYMPLNSQSVGGIILPDVIQTACRVVVDSTMDAELLDYPSTSISNSTQLTFGTGETLPPLHQENQSVEKSNKESRLRGIELGSEADCNRVINTDKWPHKVIGRVISKFKIKGHILTTIYGTGFLVGNNHVMTAAHNLYIFQDEQLNKLRIRKIWASEVTFIPGENIPRDGSKSTDKLFGEYNGRILIGFESYMKDYKEPYDIAMIILNQRDKETAAGDRLGWLGLRVSNDPVSDEIKVTVFGYPDYADKTCEIVEKKDIVGEMCKSQGLLTNKDQDYLTYFLNTLVGQSGGPTCVELCTQTHTEYYAIAVHAFGVDKINKHQVNKGVTISQQKFSHILNWLQGNYRDPQQDILIQLREAADQGDAQAQYDLAVLYKEKSISLESRDYAKLSYEYLHKSIKNNSLKSENFNENLYILSNNELGNYYYHGFGVETDHGLATTCYKRSVKRKSQDQTVFYNLGEIYQADQEIKNNFRKSLEWYQKAQELGHPDAASKVDEVKSILGVQQVSI